VAGGVKAGGMQEKRGGGWGFAYPAERNTPLSDPIVKKTDLEKLKGLKIANNLKRDSQRAGKPGQGSGKAIPQNNKLLKALLGKPAEDDSQKS